MVARIVLLLAFALSAYGQFGVFNSDAKKIRGTSVCADAPMNGEALVFDGSCYRPQAVEGGVGGPPAALAANGANCPAGQAAGGVSAAGVAEDCFSPAHDPGFIVERTNATTLTVAVGASVSNPSKAGIGASPYPFTAPMPVTVSGSNSGLLYAYVNDDGEVKIGQDTPGNIGLACSSPCSVEPTLAGFPGGSVPLWTWSVTSGSLDVNGGTDARTPLAAGPKILAGPNIIVTKTANTYTIESTATGGGGYDPTDFTSLQFRHRFADSAYFNAIAQPTPFAFTGTCFGAGVVAATATEASGVGWYGTSSSLCHVYYPNPGGATSLPLFLHGGSPATGALKWRFARATGTQDLYLGYFGAVDSAANFVGFRWSQSGGVWQCLIRSAGSDVNAVTVSGGVDTNPHSFLVTNAAGSIGCSIDGGTVATATGTIPTFTRNLIGAFVPAPGTTFTTYEVGWKLTGLSR